VAFIANGHGDHLLALPGLRATAQLFLERLTLLCPYGAGELFFSDLPLQATHELDIWRDAEGRKEFDACEAARVAGRCDLFISFNPWHTPSMQRLLDEMSPAKSIGFFPAFHAHLGLNYEQHAADLAFAVPRHIQPSLRLEDFASPLRVPQRYRDWAAAVRAGVPEKGRILIVHTETAARKRWMPRRFERALESFLAGHPEFFAFIIDQHDHGMSFGRSSSRRLISCQGLSLGEAIALVQEGDLFLGVDSCMLHAADLFRIPGVGLFGPTRSEEFGFRFGPHRHVQGDGTMEHITEDDVLDALEQLARIL
jgi:hypothetical protein